MCQKLTFFIVLCVTCLASVKADQPRPKFVDDYGAVFSQSAHVFPASAENFLLINPQAIVDTLPAFARYPVQAYPKLLAQLQLRYITHLQMGWNGILMQTLTEPIGRIEIDHPMRYIRGSVRFPMTQNSFTGELISLGALDLKGTGLSRILSK
jgi:hypothetical protein